MVTVGLVAEGTHDFIMLEPFIRAELAKKGVAEVKIRTLQPTPDETGTMSRGGWTRVLAWCKTHSAEKIDTFFSPLFANDPACDLVVLHVDGDALEHMGSHATLVVPKDPSVEARVAAVMNAVEEWLDLAPERRKKIAIAVPVLHTEAWILAARDPSGKYHNVDAKAEFRKHLSRKAKAAPYYINSVREACKPGFVSPSCESYVAFAAECQNADVP